MRIENFTKNMNRLVAQYGKAPYGQERIEIIWQEIKHMTDSWIDRVTTKFICDMRSAPMLRDFVEEAKVAGSEESSITKFTPINVCEICNGGYWVCSSKVGEVNTVMRCPCVGGPKALANSIRNHSVSPDHKLADRIERAFYGVSPDDFKRLGINACNKI